VSLAQLVGQLHYICNGRMQTPVIPLLVTGLLDQKDK
jgi:hypothetical protein